MESLYYLDDVTFNPNTHGPIDAVRSTFDTTLLGYTPDNPYSGAAYYLTITMVVLFSLVAVISNSVCQLTLGFVYRSRADLIEGAHLAYHGL